MEEKINNQKQIKMGLLKRLVVAIEKIANDDSSKKLAEMFKTYPKEVCMWQAHFQEKNRIRAMNDRYFELKSKEKLGHELSETEKKEIEIGNEMVTQGVLKEFKSL